MQIERPVSTRRATSPATERPACPSGPLSRRRKSWRPCRRYIAPPASLRGAIECCPASCSCCAATTPACWLARFLKARRNRPPQRRDSTKREASRLKDEVDRLHSKSQDFHARSTSSKGRQSRYDGRYRTRRARRSWPSRRRMLTSRKLMQPPRGRISMPGERATTAIEARTRYIATIVRPGFSESILNARTDGTFLSRRCTAALTLPPLLP
jgi:hypothetical protein